jgi:ADP-ribose pyrophosphatase YjhB (NUDIX family)
MKDQLRLAGCIIPNDAGEILLLHRNTPKRTQWEIPGGKIDEIVSGVIVASGHSALDTVLREMNEELTVQVRVIRQLGSKEFTEDQYVMHYTWFLAKIMDGKASIGEPDKYDSLRYFSQAELRSLYAELSENTKNFLDAWTNNEFSLNTDPDS